MSQPPSMPRAGEGWLGSEAGRLQLADAGAAAGRKLASYRARLYAASCLTDAFTNAYLLIVSAQGKALGASDLALGVLGTVSGSAYAFACFFAGPLSDRRGSPPLIGASLALIALVLFPLTLLSGSAWQLFIVSTCLRSALGFFWPALQRQLSLASPGTVLWRSLGAFNLAWALGIGLGDLGGPYAFALLGFRWSVAVWAVPALLALVLMLARPPAAAPPEPGLQGEVHDPARSERFLRLAWIANFCAYFAVGVLPYLFLGFAAKVGISLQMAGVILAAKDASRFLAFLILRNTSRWHYSLGWLCASQLAGGLALIGAGLVSSAAGLFVLFVVVGAYCGLSYYSSIYYGLNLRAEEGKKSGLHEGILSIGFTLGPLLAGAAGVAVPAWPGVVLAVPGTVVLLGLGVMIVLARLAPRGTIDGSAAADAAATRTE